MRLAGFWVVAVVSLLWTVSAQVAFNIVPEPRHLTPRQGVFELHQGERVEAPDDARAQWIAGFLRDRVSGQTGVELKVLKAPAFGRIVLSN